jgi:exodeoxyribonuclease-5
VLIGDGAQLPPVGSDKSPALSMNFLRTEFHLVIAEVELTEVIRQQADSGILHNATLVRQLVVSESTDYPELTTAGFSDVIKLNSGLKEELEDAIQRYGIDDTIIITRSNKRANLFNQQIRLGILDHEEEINQGDRMMVLKNNYHWLNDQPGSHSGFIANGDTLKIERILRFEERGKFRFCKATITLVDYPDLPEFDVILLCNSIWEEASALSYEVIKELFAEIAKDYEDEGSVSVIRKAVQKDPYYNALQVKFAYAITCHKAQGGQWPCVFVDKGYVTPEMHGIELNRWLYTAVTRASEKLYLVGFEADE